MAGDWIKMRTDLYRDPKVCVMADELMAADGELACYVNQMKQRDMTVTRNVTRNATVGSLVTVWGVMRHRGKRVENDLLCRGVTLSIIDDVSDMPGFGAAMASVQWAIETTEGVVFPGFFDEYNVDPTEKKAGSAAERQRRYRESKKGKGDVTRDVTRDVTVTHREEKSREEKKEKNSAVADVLEGIDPLVAADFRKLRAAKKAALTQTAVNGIAREAGKAGMSLEAALRMCCERGWSGFKAEWVKPQEPASAYDDLMRRVK